jgi:hypothetical protein
MARKRMIDPEYWSDEEIGGWSYAARLFYIALWNFADDEGRFKAHNALLKSQIFPYDKKINIQNLKKELGNKVQWYEVNNAQYGFIRNFSTYQKIDHPSESKLPPPPKFDESSGNLQGVIPPNIIEVNISKCNISKATIPPDKTELDNYFLEIELTKEDCDAFWDHYQSNGWKIGGKTPMKDWKSAARNWKRNKNKFGAINGSNRSSNQPNNKKGWQPDYSKYPTLKHLSKT